MNIITQHQINEEVLKGIQNPPRHAVCKYTDIQVNYGMDWQPNFEYCKEHNIDCVDIGRRGGVFVVNKGDIGLGYIAKGFDNSVGENVINSFAEYLKNKGLNATTDGNDILIDNYKVTSWSSHYFQEYDAMYITVHFTLSVDIELIKNICIKPMSKVPKGLTEFGINEEEVINFLENKLNTLKIN